ncbi:MAG: hypothetical protein Q9201_005137 [Fulgogasparrea decipioides]
MNPDLDDFNGCQWVHVDDKSSYKFPLNELDGFYMPPSSQTGFEPISSRLPATSEPLIPLYPLIVPQWQSQLTNPSISPPSSTFHSSISAPTETPRPIAPRTTPIEPVYTPQSVPPAPAPLPTPPSGRRILTDQDRRRMCQYYEENPTAKQVEIGVLRHKEKYLHPDDGSRSPIKRPKRPDIERAVSAKHHQSQGLLLNDEMIRDKARIFTTTVGSFDCITKVNSPVSLEKFKQKNGLLGTSLPESSMPEDPDVSQALNTGSGAQISLGISPVLPAEQDPGPPNHRMDESTPTYMDLHSTFRRTHSESPLTTTAEPQSPSRSFQQVMESPLVRMAEPYIGIDPAMYITHTRSTYGTPTFDSTSPASMATFPHPPLHSILSASPTIKNAGSGFPTSSFPNSAPSQDEARCALEIVIIFFKSRYPAAVDTQDYITLSKLAEKLKLTGYKLL